MVKTRNKKPFTDRQIRFLLTIQKKLADITDPDPEIIQHIKFSFRIENTHQFGRIPMLRFEPNSCHIKSEIMYEAGLIMPEREKELLKIRQEFGIQKARNREANFFNAEFPLVFRC